MSCGILERKAVDPEDWAGDRGEAVLALMQGLQADLQEIFSDWHDRVQDRLSRRTALPSVDVLTAALDLIAWQLSWLEHENLLRSAFYGETERTEREVIEASLAWCARHLDLTGDQLRTLQVRAGMLLAVKATEPTDPGELWRLAGTSRLETDVQDVLVHWLGEGAREGGQSVYDAVGVGISFGLPDSLAIDFLREYSLSFAASTARGSEEQIRKVLLEGLSHGRTVDDLSDEVEQVHQGLYRYQSERIARTEIIRAHAAGQITGISQLGAEAWEWTTDASERQCPICAALDGQVFAIDGEQIHPPAHPNCRCSVGLPDAEFERIRGLLLGDDVDPVFGPGASPGGGGGAAGGDPAAAAAPLEWVQDARARISQGITGEADVCAVGEIVRQELGRIVGTFTSRTEAVRWMVAQMRPVGNPGTQLWAPGSRTAVKDAFDDAAAHLPSDWLMRSNATPLLGKVVKRGYYDQARGSAPAVFAVGNTPRDRQVRTAFHEFGHRFEDVVPRIRDLEREFYSRRTAGEVPQWIGPGYRPTEVTRPDRWLRRYIGKDYGGAWYEILSMGVEGLMAGAFDYSTDGDFEAFILGLLVAL